MREAILSLTIRLGSALGRWYNMAFRTPTFNLAFNIWRVTNTVGNPPDVVGFCNLSCGKRGLQAIGAQNSPIGLAGTAAYAKSLDAYTELLLPALTDIRPLDSPLGEMDCVEVPAGSGRYYWVSWVEDVAKGFANEYRLALVIRLTGQWAAITANPWIVPAPVYPLP